MFAFALWDTQTRELICARDPFGIKPLYMATGPGGTVLGSEKKCLVDLAPTAGLDLDIDERAVQHYTVLQYVPEPETLQRGGCADWNRAATPGSARVRRRRSPATSSPPVRRGPVHPPGGEQARYDEITAALETPSPSTCAPMSRSARSCPAVSTRRPSPPWRCGTTHD